MTAPSKKVRGHTYLRDNHRCVACGSTTDLTWQHRESSGHGGRGSKAPGLTTADGVTACLTCNQGFDAEGQSRALALGWKIRRNRGHITAAEIPWFDVNDQRWFLPGPGPTRVPCLPSDAGELLFLSGNLRGEVA